LASADGLSNTSTASGVVNVAPAPPPLAVTGAAQRVGQTSARLTATVNAHGQAARFHFQWGRTRSYGAIAPRRDASIGAGLGNRVVTTTVTHLRPGTTYHYRIVASYCAGCSVGTSRGQDGTFTTRPLPQLPGSVTWFFDPGAATFGSLVAHLPRGADRILVTCSTGGCPAKRWTVTTTSSQRRCRHGHCRQIVRRLTAVDLGRQLRGHPLATGGHIQIKVLRAHYKGILFQFTIRRMRQPAFRSASL
jgi:hypothetical protein